RTLGGSTTYIGMMYDHIQSMYVDGWELIGCYGWCYRHVLPYFMRSERHEYGADDYHGGDGHVGVTAGRPTAALDAAFVAAGQQAGYGYSDDVNGYRQEGFGRVDRTTWKGKRSSTARGYLASARQRSNLTVLTAATVEKVTVEAGRASGVVLR